MKTRMATALTFFTGIRCGPMLLARNSFALLPCPGLAHDGRMVLQLVVTARTTPSSHRPCAWVQHKSASRCRRSSLTCTDVRAESTAHRRYNYSLRPEGTLKSRNLTPLTMFRNDDATSTPRPRSLKITQPMSLRMTDGRRVDFAVLRARRVRATPDRSPVRVSPIRANDDDPRTSGRPSIRER